MDFESRFRSWLDDCFATPVEENVKAFSFNLYEPAGESDVRFGIELIGAGSFDEDDPDWACDEVWEPQTRGISIPASYSGADWESCLAKMAALLERELSQDSPAADRLKNSLGIAIGFVDGDMTVIRTA